MQEISSRTARTPIGAMQRVGGKGRLVFYFYIALSATLMTLEAFGAGAPRVIRAYANDIVLPVLILLEKPIDASQKLFERLAGVSDVFLENQSLREENESLKLWRASAQQLARENESLRRMLKVPVSHIPALATARVVGVGGGAFERSILINAGSKDTIRRNAPVVNEEGLVGRVLDVGYMSSRVLLITDLNSRVPVRIDGSGILAIIEGQNSQLLKLTFMNEDKIPAVGEQLFTSGHGGAFPANIPVGTVHSVVDGQIFVETTALMTRLDFLRVLDYQTLPPEAVRPDEQTAAPAQPEGETGS
ncbi:hypothetical protein GCM10017044_27510 [Kordiimonas sediminis]|uniref:Cell shape-determining protein MreC n=1 Tax=Kordiimonas sediminis TaxID=1735581 RepID=A0A919AXL8_9PROT|nr:rod shape-determining protein MreC [Kordiimonas sediminis]GHF30625.1 hypothetical protein GCM10017044_27510 [Kordiimonas sediminis]